MSDSESVAWPLASSSSPSPQMNYADDSGKASSYIWQGASGSSYVRYGDVASHAQECVGVWMVG